MRLRLGKQVIDCSDRTAIMAVLNLATDSPVQPSVVAPEEVCRRAAALRQAGAEIIDVGAHSTRTGGETVTPQQEIDRLCPAIEALRAEGHAVSVDTWTGEVARAAAAAGAQLLNDVTAGADPALVRVAVECQLPMLIMHMRGEPKQHLQSDQRYEDIAAEVRGFLAVRAEVLTAAGVPEVWLDPGFEFGKSVDDNVRMLLDLSNLLAVGRPVVISASRKGFLGELLGHPKLPFPELQQAPGLLEATLAFNVLAAYFGTHVVRVHDVAAVAPALRVVNEVRARRGRPAGPEPGGYTLGSGEARSKE